MRELATLAWRLWFTGAALAAAIVWATAPGRLHWLDALLRSFGRVS